MLTKHEIDLIEQLIDTKIDLNKVCCEPWGGGDKIKQKINQIKKELLKGGGE